MHDFGTSDGQYVWIPELSPSEVARALRCMQRDPQSCEQSRIADLLAAFGGRPRPILQHLRAAEWQSAALRGGKRCGKSSPDTETPDANARDTHPATGGSAQESKAAEENQGSQDEAEFAPTNYLDLERRENPWLSNRRNDIKICAAVHNGNIIALQHSLAARTASWDRAWSHELVGYTPSPGLQRATIKWATPWVAWTTTQYLMASSREKVLEALAWFTFMTGTHGRLFGTIFEMAVHTLLQGDQVTCPFRQLDPGTRRCRGRGENSGKGDQQAVTIIDRKTRWPTSSWRQWRVDTPTAAIRGDDLRRYTCTYIVPAVSTFPVVDGLLCLDATHLHAFLGIRDKTKAGARGGGVLGIKITNAAQHAPKFETFVQFALTHCMTAAGECVLTDLVYVVPEAQFAAYQYQPITVPQKPADTAYVPPAVMEALKQLRQWVLCVPFEDNKQQQR